MADEKGRDDKIISVCHNDPAYEHCQDLKDIPKHVCAEVRQFFIDYKVLENKKVRIQSWDNNKAADKLIWNAIYNQH